LTNWSKRRVIVTGGAGLIGGAITDQLLEKGANVTVVDNLMHPNNTRIREAKLKRLAQIYASHGREPQLQIVDLYTERDKFKILAKDHDVVFHMAAIFGGRQFVDERQTECSQMLATDHNVISASCEAGIEHLHYASSACVYPPSLNKPGRLLGEEDILTTGEKWNSSDNLYGFAKLMGELQLRVLNEEHEFQSSVSRYLTVYGPGEFDSSHAIAALIEKAIRREDPYLVWGSGLQERGFTYVNDIARGSILAADNVTDATPVNLGWDKRYKIHEVAEVILGLSGHKPKKVYYDKTKPEGPFSRALDISRANKLLGWSPVVDLEDGLKETIEWHKANRGLPVELSSKISVGD
jgi:nucleoside-diphosphate-sugar epimerase